MPDLEIRLLGPTTVLLDGEVVALPPSQKTRALLVYLALTPHAVSREGLCGLLWPHADDPRGALRWSLSRLRAAVDQGARPIVKASRRDVALELGATPVDALAAAAAVRELRTCPTEALSAHVRALSAELAADLQLDDSPEFSLWLAAERERFRGLALEARRALIDRLAEQPEAAIPHLRDQVREDPLDEEARARLVRMLGVTGRLDEAEAQVQAAREARRAMGATPSGELGRAWREARGAPQARVAPRPQAPARRESQELVGRGVELSWLLEALGAVLSSGQGRLLLLTGEPGVGKSRLLSALLENARSRGVAVLHGRAHEVELRPYGPWVDALRQLRVLSDPEWLRRLGPLVGEGERESGGKERLYAAMSELVAQLADPGGVVLALDDVHWADEASTALMHFVTRSLLDRPVLTVLIARDGELAEHQALQRGLAGLRRAMPLDTRRLGPLDPEATARLARSVDPNVDARDIHAQSSGNPLLTLELARSGQGGAGQAVGAIIRDRLLALPEEARELLRWAAVLGSAFQVERLARAAPLEAGALVNALGALETHALLVTEEDGLRATFAHDLVWRTVHAELAPAQRRLMHRRVAELLGAEDLRDPEVAAELARHAELAGDASAAARACVLAGQHCVRVFANTEARALAERGLRCAAALRDPEKVERQIELMSVSLTAEPPADVKATLAELDEMGERAVLLGSVAHGRSAYMMASTLRFERNQWASALSDSMRAERIGRLGDASAQVEALGDTARCLLLLERDVPQADAMAREARALARQAGRTPPSVPLSLGMLAAWRGDLQEAVTLLEEA
ncbi:MAG: AAA family ATPase, partial [Alphaproteobacteria bacterium]|nr:AAA family ATPase [Alphaproteobacteria bacterium]MCB9797664.1 AAA family ATPase [Alphaproteobacteria bacterium]